MIVTDRDDPKNRLYEQMLALQGLHAEIVALTIAQERMPEYPRDGGTIADLREQKISAFDTLMGEITSEIWNA